MRVDAAILGERLDRLLDSIERRRDQLSRTADAIRELRLRSDGLDAELANMFFEAFSLPTDDSEEISFLQLPSDGDGSPPHVTSSDFNLSGTTFQRIMRYFELRDNRPATNQDIRTALKLTRGAVAVVLYSTHPLHFEKLEGLVPNKTSWRIREKPEVVPETSDDDIPF